MNLGQLEGKEEGKRKHPRRMPCRQLLPFLGLCFPTFALPEAILEMEGGAGFSIHCFSTLPRCCQRAEELATSHGRDPGTHLPPPKPLPRAPCPALSSTTRSLPSLGFFSLPSGAAFAAQFLSELSGQVCIQTESRHFTLPHAASCGSSEYHGRLQEPGLASASPKITLRAGREGPRPPRGSMGHRWRREDGSRSTEQLTRSRAVPQGSGRRSHSRGWVRGRARRFVHPSLAERLWGLSREVALGPKQLQLRVPLHTKLNHLGTPSDILAMPCAAAWDGFLIAVPGGGALLLAAHLPITRLTSISSPSTTHRATRSVPQPPVQRFQPRGELC